jgi:hypothetical protein
MAYEKVSEDLTLEVYKILREARANAKKETRDEDRYPFFRPVTIDIGKFRLSGFSREVSERGIGLLHNTGPATWRSRSHDLDRGRVLSSSPNANRLVQSLWRGMVH